MTEQECQNLPVRGNYVAGSVLGNSVQGCKWYLVVTLGVLLTLHSDDDGDGGVHRREVWATTGSWEGSFINRPDEWHVCHRGIDLE